MGVLRLSKGGQKIGTSHDELGRTYTSGIYMLMSVTLIRSCMPIVVAVVGVRMRLRVR